VILRTGLVLFYSEVGYEASFLVWRPPYYVMSSLVVEDHVVSYSFNLHRNIIQQFHDYVEGSSAILNFESPTRLLDYEKCRE